MTRDSSTDVASLQASYYRQLAEELGARLARSTERQAQSYRDAIRSRAIARLIRDVYRIGDVRPSDQDLEGQFLRAVIEHMLCDGAVLLKEDPRGSQNFVVVRYVGMKIVPVLLGLEGHRLQNFAFFSHRDIDNPLSVSLKKLTGVADLLWGFDAGTGNALVITSRVDKTIGRPFEAGDRELIEGALAVYIDTVQRKRSENLLRQAKQSAEARDRAAHKFLTSILDRMDVAIEQGATSLRSVVLDEVVLTDASNYNALKETNLALSHMARIVLDCRDIIESNDVPASLDREWIDIDPVLAASVRAVYAASLKRGVEIVLDPSSAAMDVCVDQIWMQVVISNLLTYAIRSTERGERLILAAHRQPNGTCDITISGKWRLDQGRDGFGDRKSTADADEMMFVTQRLVEAHGATLTLWQRRIDEGKIVLILAACDIREKIT